MSDTKTQDDPVAAQCRFKSEPTWRECSVEHALMVLANPEEWVNGYEVRFLSVYTTVQQPTHPERQPLTDEQIRDIVREAGRGSALRRDGNTSLRIARAIERAHGIGAKGGAA